MVSPSCLPRRSYRSDPAAIAAAPACAHTHIRLVADVTSGLVGPWGVECLDCGDRGPTSELKADALEFWQDAVRVLKICTLAELGDPFSSALVEAEMVAAKVEQGIPV